MEVLRVVPPGGGRDATDVTSGAIVAVDLTALIGHYVTLTWDQAVYFVQAPAAGTFAFDVTANAVPFAVYDTGIAPAGTNTVVPERVQRDAISGLAVARDVYVSNRFPRLLVQAQSTTATYTEAKTTSLKTDI